MMKAPISRTLQQIGLANLLWNRVEVLWYLYFTVLLSGTNRAKVDAIYRSLDTGSKKRALIVSVAAEVYDEKAPELAAVRAVMSKTNDAASKRNSLIHADYHLAEENGRTNLRISRGGDHSKPNRLAFLPLDKELSQFIRTLKSLIAEVESLLPAPPAPPPGVAGVLTTVRWVQLLDESIAAEATSGS